MAKKKAKPRRKTGASRKSGKKNIKRYKARAAKRRAKLAPKRKIKMVKKAPIKILSAKASKKLHEQERKAEALMARGRQRGFVTYDEILKSFPNIEEDVLFLEEL